MTETWDAELVWWQGEGGVELRMVIPARHQSEMLSELEEVQVSSLQIPIASALTGKRVLYRHPILVTYAGGRLSAGPVFAVLAASDPRRDEPFIGSKANFRALLRTAKQGRKFMFVVPAHQVRGDTTWYGWVCQGKRWLQLPCPRPEAVYNRIPTRKLERTTEAVRAKAILQSLGVPMFNPSYFSKARIYRILSASRLQQYLPETVEAVTKPGLRKLLQRHRALYLKPSGGSIGHGIMRVERASSGYTLRVQKHAHCRTFHAGDEGTLWGLLQEHRLQGNYVLQSAVDLLQWQGRPCDFRVLLQKRAGEWRVIGKGVRVAGTDTITTHVPNGGTIADAAKVLNAAFGDARHKVNRAIDHMVIQCAKAIDQRYQGTLGEMSMDVGVDVQGRPWFFEANAKPMKFDEPDIRRRSLLGVLAYLEELRSGGGSSVINTRFLR